MASLFERMWYQKSSKAPFYRMLYHSLRRVLFYHHTSPYQARTITRYLSSSSEALGELKGQRPPNSGLFKRTIVDLSLSKIVNGTGDSGVKIDPFGQLEIVSEEKSLRRQKTALVLSRASQSLTKYDFLRVLDPDLSRDQPEEVLPVRHHRNLHHCNSWVLIFTSPAQAKRYQNRVATLRSFVAEYAQKRSSITTIYSPPNLRGNNRTLWGFKRNDYTLTSPFQSLSLVAKLSPFDQKLRQAINTQANLLGSRRDGQQSFPVRLWVDVSKYPILNLQAIEELLELDGLKRGSPWLLSSHRGAIISATQDPTTQTSREGCQNLEWQSSANSTDNWLIHFACISAAKRFVRLWHRRHLPRLDNLYYYNCHLIIKTECLF